MDAKPLLNIKSLKEQVYEYLREQMRSGELRPGSVIDMEETSKKLGVSKTPLRDALLQLEMEDFVTILPRRKVVVNSLTLQDIRNYYQIIGSLESTAILLAFDRLGEEDYSAMEKMIETMKKALNRDDFDVYFKNNLLFHRTYLKASENISLVKIVSLLKKRLYDFPRMAGCIKEWEASSVLEHEKLLSLFRQKKKKEAADYIRDVHWSFEAQENYIIKYYPDAK
jgi:DNA-binding GntR family transcriptional regulator